MPTTPQRGWIYPADGEDPYFATIEALFTAQDTDVATALERPWLDAKAYGGAIGNGLANDTPALAFAISAINAAGGGVLYVPPGTYLLGAALTLTAGVSLRGAGRGVTIFKRGFTTGTMLTSNGDQLVADCTCDGDAAGAWGTGNAELNVTSDRVVIERCEFRNGRGSMFASIASGADSVWFRNCKFIGTNNATTGVGFGIWADGGLYEDLQITGCEFRDLRLNGVFARGATIINSYFENNHIQTSTGGGHVSTLGSVPSVLIGNTLVGGASVTSGFELNGDALVSGNRLISIPGAGIVLQAGSGYVVTGNIVIGCGDAGVIVGGGVTDITITSNQIKSSGTWGIEIQAGASDRYTIAENIFASNTSGDLSDGGTGTSKSTSQRWLGELVASSSAIANTTADTTFNKSLTIPAGIVNRAGTRIYVKASGIVSCTGSPSLTIRMRLQSGGKTIADMVLAISSASNQSWFSDGAIIVRTSGASGTGAGESGVYGVGLEGLSATLADGVFSGYDWTAAKTVEVAAQWSAADPANTVTLTGLHVEVWAPDVIVS